MKYYSNGTYTKFSSKKDDEFYIEVSLNFIKEREKELFDSENFVNKFINNEISFEEFLIRLQDYSYSFLKKILELKDELFNERDRKISLGIFTNDQEGEFLAKVSRIDYWSNIFKDVKDNCINFFIQNNKNGIIEYYYNTIKNLIDDLRMEFKL